MTITRRAAFAAVTLAVACLSLFVVWPIQTAAQAPVDRTGLDILCSGKGDVYSPPVKGVSSCIFADGQVLVCDSATDKCYEGKDGKVDRLGAQMQALSAARK